jgi:hypothetical protein
MTLLLMSGVALCFALLGSVIAIAARTLEAVSPFESDL